MTADGTTVVLDLEKILSHLSGPLAENIEYIVTELRARRGVAQAKIADQIEAQTKPPLEEPGVGGVVRSGLTHLADPKLRVRLPQGWTNLEADGPHVNTWDWDDLVDPVLVREGVDG